MFKQRWVYTVDGIFFYKRPLVKWKKDSVVYMSTSCSRIPFQCEEPIEGEYCKTLKCPEYKHFKTYKEARVFMLERLAMVIKDEPKGEISASGNGSIVSLFGIVGWGGLKL